MKPLRTDALLAPVHALGVLAQTGSFTRAAQHLGLSKAAVSQRIAELERAVGVPLVQRTTRSVRLTEAGQQLVADTLDGWRRIEEALTAAHDLADTPRGLVRVTAPVALGRQHIAPLLTDFLRRWPEIRVELDLSDRLVNLAQDGFDLAIRHTSAPPDTHVAWRLCTSRTLLVATSVYLRRRGTPAHPSELDRHDCLPYLRSGPSVWHFEALDTAAGDEPQRVSVAVQGPLRASNSEVLREATLAGLGIGLLPDFSAAVALRAGRLKPVLPGWQAVGVFGDGIYALRPWSAHVPKAVRTLVAHLRAAMAGGLAGE